MFNLRNRARESAALRTYKSVVRLRGVPSSIRLSCATCGMSMHSRAWTLPLCALDSGRLLQRTCIDHGPDPKTDPSQVSFACIHILMPAPRHVRVPLSLLLKFLYRVACIMSFIMSRRAACRFGIASRFKERSAR